MEKAVERFGSRPILFVTVEGDRRMPPHIARRLFERSASPEKQLLILPGTRHGEAFSQNSERYKQAVISFLAEVRGDAGPENVGTGAPPAERRKMSGAGGR